MSTLRARVLPNPVPRHIISLLRHRAHPGSIRYRLASTSTGSAGPKPVAARVLEQPDKFRPPSHAAHRRKRNPFPGPPLSDHERAAQQTRRYPHMMPPEGTFMHWFLTSRLLHTYISLSILVSLAFFVVLTNFLTTTIYRDQLPPNSLAMSHPFRFIRQYWHVYQMHTMHISAETAERRRNNVEDVRKRSEYRKAHGLDTAQEGVFGAWSGRTEDHTPPSDQREGVAGLEESPVASVHPVSGRGVKEAEIPGTPAGDASRSQLAKKWFGIW